jgi:hypothetical protein
MDVEAANQALQSGKFQSTIHPLIEQLKPESCYFTTEGGKRTAYIVFNLSDPSRIPSIAEPVMNMEDLAKGLQAWGARKVA